MPTRPLACPNCRTWFEGSGRVRCPSCGHRFHADAAALDTPRPAGDTAWTVSTNAAGNAPVPEFRVDASDVDPATQDDLRYAEPGSWQTDSHTAHTPVPQPSTGGVPNLSVLFTIALVVFFILGPRFLEGTLFLGVLFLLIAARWLAGSLSRSGNNDSTG